MKQYGYILIYALTTVITTKCVQSEFHKLRRTILLPFTFITERILPGIIQVSQTNRTYTKATNLEFYSDMYLTALWEGELELISTRPPRG